MSRDILIDITGEEVENDEPKFPVDGQEYEFWVVKLPDCDDTPTILDGHLAGEVCNAFAYDLVPGDGSTLDDYAFSGQEMITGPGLWRVKATWIVEYHTDWESGGGDYEFGFSITSAEKV